MNHLSLFTGIGGIDLAAEWAGFTTVGQVEINDYATKVLEKHWPNVPRWRDIRDVTAESFERVTGLRTVDLVSGGFPCQPFSVAGKRRGKEDDRYLWPEMFRVIRELKPTWIVGENVAGFVNMGLDEAISNLENEGYEVQTFIIPACAVEAWHERKRCFIVAYSKHAGRNETENIGMDTGTQQEEQAGEKLLCNEFEGIGSVWETTNNDGGRNDIFQNAGCELSQGSIQSGEIPDEIGKRNANIIERPSEMVSDTNQQRLQGHRGLQECTNKWIAWTGSKPIEGIWKLEPDVGRVATRIPARVDRLKRLGNAVVPQQVLQVLQAIMEVSKS